MTMDEVKVSYSGLKTAKKFIDVTRSSLQNFQANLMLILEEKLK